MPTTSYTANRTGLLLADPYNDSSAQAAKLSPLVGAVASQVILIDNLRLK